MHAWTGFGHLSLDTNISQAMSGLGCLGEKVYCTIKQTCPRTLSIQSTHNYTYTYLVLDQHVYSAYFLHCI